MIPPSQKIFQDVEHLDNEALALAK